MHPGLLLEVREQVNACDRGRLLAESKTLLRAVTREGILHQLKRLEACVEKPADGITAPA